MDWMYKGVSGIVDREDYLTGRKIDKTFEMLDKDENPNLHKDDSVSFQSVDFQNLISSSSSDKKQFTLMSKSDIMAKMHEDPLFEIKMKQLEQRKKLLENPLKLKKLKDILKSSLEEDIKQSKKNKHKRKKTSKKKESTKKHRSHKKSSKKRKTSKHSHSLSENSSSEDSSSSNEHLSSSSSSEDEVKNSKNSKNHYEKSHHKVSRQEKDYRRKSPSPNARSSHNRKISESKLYHHSNDKPYRNDNKRKRSSLTEEELNRRRQEMMQNAEWREQSRKDHVRKLTEQERLEEESSKNRNPESENFIKPMLLNMAEQNSIEDSVRQKRFKLQKKTSGAMEQNFVRR